MTECLLVSTLTGDRSDASSLAYSAVKAQLAASAQAFPVPLSVYWLRGMVGEAEEWQVVFQTTAELHEKLQAHLLERHPRENPEMWTVDMASAPPHHLRRIIEDTASAP